MPPIPCADIALERRVDFVVEKNHLRLRQGRPATSARRLIGRLAQIRRKIKEEDEREHFYPQRGAVRRDRIAKESKSA